MKLLLTSGGIKNDGIAQALFGLADKEADKLKLAFIPTAANVEDKDKSWLIDDLTNFKKLGFAKIDIVDIAALEKAVWESRLESSDILVFGGGNTEYLVELINKIGLTDLLSTWLEDKVLVGISAGSVMCGSVINPSGEKGLNLVDFLIVPHMNSSFSKRTKDDIQGYSSMMKRKTYWLDDDSAVKVDGYNTELVGFGKFEVFQ
jgi:dipeptidase E